MLAIERGNLKITKSLIARGAKLNSSQRDGTNTLDFVLEKRDLETARMLLD